MEPVLGLGGISRMPRAVAIAIAVAVTEERRGLGYIDIDA